jgi:hypothetical protein
MEIAADGGHGSCNVWGMWDDMREAMVESEESELKFQAPRRTIFMNNPADVMETSTLWSPILLTLFQHRKPTFTGSMTCIPTKLSSFILMNRSRYEIAYVYSSEFF